MADLVLHTGVVGLEVVEHGEVVFLLGCGLDRCGRCGEGYDGLSDGGHLDLGFGLDSGKLLGCFDHRLLDGSFCYRDVDDRDLEVLLCGGFYSRGLRCGYLCDRCLDDGLVDDSLHFLGGYLGCDDHFGLLRDILRLEDDLLHHGLYLGGRGGYGGRFGLLLEDRCGRIEFLVHGSPEGVDEQIRGFSCGCLLPAGPGLHDVIHTGIHPGSSHESWCVCFLDLEVCGLGRLGHEYLGRIRRVSDPHSLEIIPVESPRGLDGERFVLIVVVSTAGKCSAELAEYGPSARAETVKRA